MKCPICGSKLFGNQICKYCGITDEQIVNASNKKVKEYRATDKSDLVYYSTVVPKDVSRIKLILYTIFFGFLGIHHLFVQRKVRGIYSLIVAILTFLVVGISFAVPNMAGTVKDIFSVIFDGIFLLFTINIILWIFDIIAVFCKGYKIPVVLAERKK